MRKYKETESLLAAIREAAYTFPELRVGEIIENALADAGPFRGPDVLTVEDDRLAESIRAYIVGRGPR